MVIKMREQLVSVGVDYDEVLKRFMGKEDFYLRMLKKFLNDKNFAGLKEAVAGKSWEEAFTYAHTVKGLCGNLGLGGIMEHVAPMTEELRSQPYDEEKIVDYMQRAQTLYDQTVEIIQSL